MHLFYFSLVGSSSSSSSSSNLVVDASTVSAFEAHLDEFWSPQTVKFDSTAELTGTGNLCDMVD